MDTGTVYQACDPTLTVGFATSPNMSRGTAHLTLILEAVQDREL